MVQGARIFSCRRKRTKAYRLSSKSDHARNVGGSTVRVIQQVSLNALFRSVPNLGRPLQTARRSSPKHCPPAAIMSRFSVDGLRVELRIGLSWSRARGSIEPAYALHRRQAYLSFSFHQRCYLTHSRVIRTVLHAHRNPRPKRRCDPSVFRERTDAGGLLSRSGSRWSVAWSWC